MKSSPSLLSSFLDAVMKTNSSLQGSLTGLDLLIKSFQALSYTCQGYSYLGFRDAQHKLSFCLLLLFSPCPDALASSRFLAFMLVAVSIQFFLVLYISNLFKVIEMLYLEKMTFHKQQSALHLR